MALSGAGRADEMQDLGAIDEAEFGERHDAVLVERRLEGEVEAGERFDGGQARHDERRFHATGLTQGERLSQQGVDGFKRGHIAAFEATQGGVYDSATTSAACPIASLRAQLTPRVSSNWRGG